MKKLKLEEIKSLQIDILKYVAEFCEKKDLRYFLSYGTLLGAIRHNGYIPWDDDIDIAMERKDYLIFIDTFNNNSSEYRVASHYIDPNYPYTFAKIYNINTSLIELSDLEYSIGINIDLFPLDYLPSVYINSIVHIGKMKMLINLLHIKNIKIQKQRVWYKNLILKIGKFILKPIDFKIIIKKIDSMSLKYRKSNSKYMGNLCLCTYGIKEIVKKDVFKNIIKVEFEGNLYNAPELYHIWLKSLYGDYMKLPAIIDQVSHHNFEATLKVHSNNNDNY
jgi:lipopolysaccharide cholinephosphotransferase